MVLVQSADFPSSRKGRCLYAIAEIVEHGKGRVRRMLLVLNDRPAESGVGELGKKAGIQSPTRSFTPAALSSASYLRGKRIAYSLSGLGRTNRGCPA